MKYPVVNLALSVVAVTNLYITGAGPANLWWLKSAALLWTVFVFRIYILALKGILKKGGD